MTTPPPPEHSDALHAMLGGRANFEPPPAPSAPAAEPATAEPPYVPPVPEPTARAGTFQPAAGDSRRLELRRRAAQRSKDRRQSAV